MPELSTPRSLAKLAAFLVGRWQYQPISLRVSPRLEKRRRLHHLRRYVLTQRDHVLHPDQPDFDSEAEKYIPIIELVHVTRTELARELGQLFSVYQRGLGAFSNKLEALKKAPLTPKQTPKRLLVHTHLTNFITGHYRSWVGIVRLPSLFDKDVLTVEMIVNMIDNIHVCRSLIRKQPGFPLTLDQIITWRDAELMMTEVLAGQLFAHGAYVDQSDVVFKNSKVLAVDHCLNTVADLLLDKEKYQIYTAFPISKIRDIDRLISILGDITADCKNESMVLRKLNPQNLSEQKDQARADADLAVALASQHTHFSDAKRSLEEQNREFRAFFAQTLGLSPLTRRQLMKFPYWKSLTRRTRPRLALRATTAGLRCAHLTCDLLVVKRFLQTPLFRYLYRRLKNLWFRWRTVMNKRSKPVLGGKSGLEI